MVKKSASKIKLTRLDYFIEIMGWLIVCAMWIFIITTYKNLPDTIPIHYNAAGTPDNFGNKNSIFSLPIISTILFIGLSILNNFPEFFNYPIEITEDNAIIQYRYATRLIRFLKLGVVIIFGFILYTTTTYTSGKSGILGVWFFPMLIGIVFVPLLIYVAFSLKSK